MAAAVQFLDGPKKTGDPDGAAGDKSAGKPADRPALGAYRRKAS